MTKNMNNMNNNILSKAAIRANIMNHVDMYKINLNDIDAHLNELEWGGECLSLEFHDENRDDRDGGADVFDLAPSSVDTILNNDEEYVTLLAKDLEDDEPEMREPRRDHHVRAWEIISQIRHDVIEVLTEMLTEPRTYKLMKKDEGYDEVCVTFPANVDASSIHFRWEDNGDGIYNYECEFTIVEDGVREHSGILLMDSVDDDNEASDYEAIKAVEDNYYIFSTFAEAV